jgi:hypothetical protein
MADDLKLTSNEYSLALVVFFSKFSTYRDLASSLMFSPTSWLRHLRTSLQYDPRTNSTVSISTVLDGSLGGYDMFDGSD